MCGAAEQQRVREMCLERVVRNVVPCVCVIFVEFWMAPRTSLSLQLLPSALTRTLPWLVGTCAGWAREKWLFGPDCPSCNRHKDEPNPWPFHLPFYMAAAILTIKVLDSVNQGCWKTKGPS